MFRTRRRRTDLAKCPRARSWRLELALEVLEPRQLLASFVVDNTADGLAPVPAGSLRAAILAVNADPNPDTDSIVFAIPASTAPGDNVPVPGFDPSTQTWKITLDSPLPPITHSVSIDGYSQAHFPIPYLYPDQISSAEQFLAIIGATGGSFTLTTSAPLPVATTASIPYNATAAQVQAALDAALEPLNMAGSVSVTGPALGNGGTQFITFQGAFGQQAIPDLIASNNLTGGIGLAINIGTTTVGGVVGAPTLISSVPNSVAALQGNNAKERVFIDGTKLPGGPADIGFAINASDSILRGLIIDGFDVGVSVPNPGDVGNLIQGNFIGDFVVYPVDPETGIPLPSPDTVELVGPGNTQQGVLLGSTNTTVGGTDPQDNNVISGNGAQGVLLQPGTSGNQVLGNQIGVVGPIVGYYYQVGNGAEGVLIQSSGTAGNPSSIVYSSSNIIGGAVAGAGNIISDNSSHGVHIVGVGATRNLVEANYIGAAPGGGYVFGAGDPGNQGDGVWLDDAPHNQVGGPVSSDGNVISANQGDGVDITGVDAAGNTVLNNIIGLTAGGSAVLGNAQAGVADYAPGTLVGPGNVISANLMGVLISGATATNVTVIDNLIGTDGSGEADLGNAEAGVEIDSATGVIIEGNGRGSQVISGNLVGVEINGSSAMGNLVEGNFIGTDQTGTADRGNSAEGVLIEGAAGNTVGGTVSAASNVISTNHWGIRIDGATAMSNLIEGNDVGTDVTGIAPLGNEVNGIIISNDASANTIGGGNTIAFNRAAGVSVQSGTGNAIQSNSIFSNGHLGIELLGTANDSQSAPSILAVAGGGTGSNIQGSFTSVANTSFLIQFFSSIAPDPSGFGQGQTFLDSTTIMTDASGQAMIDFNLSGGVAVGAWVTATATDQKTGDTSAFSNAISAQPVSVAFSMPDFPVVSTAGSVMVDVQRSGNLSVQVSVSYAASNGTAIAGQDYTAVSGTFIFLPNQTDETFSVPILANPGRSTPFSIVNLTLSQPIGGATLGTISSATVTIANQSNPHFMTFLVVNTGDSGPGTLRDAVTAANNDSSPGTDYIGFDIPTSTAANLNEPVPGFDPVTQTWKIMLDSPLPVITHSIVIDGYSQANLPVSYNYPDQISSAVQLLTEQGLPTAGTFTLTLRTSPPLPVPTTLPIPFNATAAQVQSALEAIIGHGNVAVTLGPLNTTSVISIAFQGVYADQAIPDLIPSNNLTGGISPSVAIQTTTVGGVPIGSPTMFSSVPNSVTAIDGNNAQVRVIIDGSKIPSGPADIGFVINASNSILRGLAIGGFGVGVSVPATTDVGDLIQGNFIGVYLSYPVNPLTGVLLPAPNNVFLAGQGNAQQGVVLGSRNATLGGIDPQAANVIGRNGAQGVWIEPGASGNQVLDNQIGLAGPSSNGRYFLAGNGAEGVLIQSSGTASLPSSIVYASSNIIGGAVTGSGNLISLNHSYGVHIVGVGATRNLVEANYIGTPPGGGYLYGIGQPGNLLDGVWIDDAPDNQVGGPASSDGNVISSNQGDGVDVTGNDAVGNTVLSNIIGLTSDGTAVLGNDQAGVADTAPGTVIGPGNAISANRIGVLISGAAATNVTVIGNLIGTSLTGEADLGNAQAGVDIESASGITVEGDSGGSQVISGNLVGVEINGSTSTQNLVAGNFIGTDKAGNADRGNSNEGVLIEGASGNTIGGTQSSARNVISTNHWGIRIDGATATANLIEGSFIGTDTTGTAPLGNEVNGIIISNGASGNSIGGTVAGQGNTIAFNAAAGVIVESGTGDAILSNSIFSNGQIGISLSVTGNGNDLIAAPVLASAAIDTSTNSTNVQGTYTSQPSSTFLIQFFSNVSADPSGNFEGQTFLGSSTVTTDATGAASFDVELPIIVASGTWITATVTYLSTMDSNPTLHQSDTSEFSLQVLAINPFVVTTTADTGTVGTLRYAIDYSNANPTISASAPNQIMFKIPGVGLQTISLSSALPPIMQPVVIDGYSQAGSSTNTAIIDDAETDVAVLTVQIDPAEMDHDPNGLTIEAPNTTVDGLSITGFSGAGIALEPSLNTVGGALGDTIWGDFIGVSQFNPKTFNPVSSKTANANGVGILIDSPNNVIGGTTPQYRNVIQGNSAGGVILYGSQGTRNTLDTNFILDNGGDGVLVLSATNQIGQAIGQGPSGAGNVISGNAANGVHILGPSARGNVVSNNEIGTQIGLAFSVSFTAIRGTQPRPNGSDGVLIENASTNVIGGQIPDAGNVIAGNTLDGVVIENYVDGTVPSIIQSPPVINLPADSATANDVQGNSIGFNNRNLLIYPIANRDGVNISSSGNLIGGNSPAAQNVIILNNRNGVTISANQLDAHNNPLGAIPNATPTSNAVEGNFIGTQSGNNDYGNTLDGVLLYGASNNTIGGTTSAALNVISTNNMGIVIQTPASTGNVVAGNDIGTTSDGTRVLGNFSDGVAILDSPGNVIGGSVAGAGNIIAGNGGNGVYLSGASSTGNFLWGNLIGTNSRGGDLLGNSLDGVLVDNDASNNLIGESSSGTGASNMIAFNAGSGVGILSGTGNSILSNSIFSNAQRGIILGGTGNDAQSAPALTAAIPSSSSSSTVIQGTLNSVPGTSFRIEFFSNTVADPSGYGQGQTLIGAATVVTDTSGSTSFSLTLPIVVAPGLVVSATATNLSTGDTSAFSVDVISSPIDVQFIESSFVANLATGQATISVEREGNPNAQVTVSYTTSNGTAQAGINYTSTSGTLVFNSGVSVRSFTIPLITSSPPFDELTVNLSLANPTGGAGLGTPSTAVLTILNDRAPGVQFSSALFQVTEAAGLATITVYRVGNLNGTVTVNYAATAGTAIPGEDFTPVSGTLTFPPGVAQQSFTVQVQTRSPNTNDATVNLTLSNQTGGAVLGTPSTAILTITKPVTLVSEQVVSNGRAITAIAFTFSKPLYASRAQDLGNYGYYAISAGKNGVFGTGGDGYTTLSSAVYNSAADTVTLTPSAPLRLNTFYRITIDGQTSPLLNNGITDVAGNQLAGSSGVAGTPFITIFAAGPNLSYTDSARNVVKLQLKQGGLMEMFRSADGQVVQLQLAGTIARKSTLSGSVNRGRGGTGRTFLPPIAGAAGVRIRLKTPPFFFQAPTLVRTASRSAALDKAEPAAAVARPLISGPRRHR